jgi:prepilin-type N-terminal cleavage/methylation domain-containing protein
MRLNGFTLIEVLIASLILFVAISSATIVFSGAVKSKQNATSAITNYAYVPILIEHISVQVRRASDNETTLDGQGYLLGADYRWQATIERQAPIKRGPLGASGPTDSSRRVLFWRINLNVKHNNKEQDYSFNVTGWIS